MQYQLDLCVLSNCWVSVYVAVDVCFQFARISRNDKCRFSWFTHINRFNPVQQTGPVKHTNPSLIKTFVNLRWLNSEASKKELWKYLRPSNTCRHPAERLTRVSFTKDVRIKPPRIFQLPCLQRTVWSRACPLACRSPELWQLPHSHWNEWGSFCPAARPLLAAGSAWK